MAIVGSQNTLRANYVPGLDPSGPPTGGRTQSHWLNTAAFARPAAGQLGTSPRNGIIGPSYLNTDLSLFKDVRLADKEKVQFRIEVLNVFNKKNFRTIDTNMTSATFGAVTASEPPRIVQLGAKFTF